jgi:hypothetical protein
MKRFLAIALASAMFCTGCSTAWVSTLDSILAAAAPALIDILQIVAAANGQPLNSTLTTKINADASSIKTLAADFAAASAGAAPGVCQQLQSAVRVYQADQQLVLQVAQVGDPNTQAKIALLANLVAGTVSAITAAIPPCQNTAAIRSIENEGSYGASNFIDQYNRILVAPTGMAPVDVLTPKLKLYVHSKFVRAISFGRLQ